MVGTLLPGQQLGHSLFTAYAFCTLLISKQTEIQSQKTQGFGVADFATLRLTKESHVRNFSAVHMDKRTLHSKI